MAAFKIPDPYRKGVEVLLALEPDVQGRLVAAVKSSAVFLSRATLSSNLKEAVPELQPEAVRAIVDALVSLNSAAVALGMDARAAAAAVADAAAKEFQPPPQPETLTSFVENLEALIQADAIGAAGKASAVWGEHQRAYCSSRILTDLRPVFQEDPSKTPLAAGIVHTLRIAFHSGSPDVKAFYVALDSADLAELARMIERAEAKERTLRGLLRKTEVPELNVER